MTKEQVITRVKHSSMYIDDRETADYIIKALEQQPSDDCIARQPLIDNWKICADMLMCEGDSEIVMEWIFDAPPVTPTHGTCEDCKHIYCEHHEETCDIDEYNPDFYCADFERRGSKDV